MCMMMASLPVVAPMVAATMSNSCAYLQVRLCLCVCVGVCMMMTSLPVAATMSNVCCFMYIFIGCMARMINEPLGCVCHGDGLWQRGRVHVHVDPCLMRTCDSS